MTTLKKTNSCSKKINILRKRSLKSIPERQILLSLRSLGSFCLTWVVDSAGDFCFFNAVWYLLWGVLVRVLLYSQFQWHQAQVKKFLLFFAHVHIIPTPAAHPSPTAGSPSGQPILPVASLYTKLCQQCESRTWRFYSFSFWREALGGDFYILRSKRRTLYDAWGIQKMGW